MIHAQALSSKLWAIGSQLTLQAHGLQALGDLARRHGIALVIRFGSTVTGRRIPAATSILACCSSGFREHSTTNYGDRRSAGARVPGRPVDVAVLNRADPLLLKQVAEHARLEYGTDARFDAFRRYAFKRYQDHRRFFDMAREYVERVTAGGRG